MAISYYEIWRAESSSSSQYFLIGTSTSKSFVDTSVVDGTLYCYIVIAVDDSLNRSPASNSSCVLFTETILGSDVSFTKDNLICVYREDDSDSLYYAERYKNLRDLDSSQLIAIPCSNNEILDSYSTFQQEVENPILEAINLFSDREIYGIVLMPFVPGGFIDGSDKISTTSRLSKINQVFSKKSNNDIYDRQIFKRFDGIDALNVLICSRIDGPNSVVSEWFTRMEASLNDSTVHGGFYVDSYSAYTQSGASQYTGEVLDFSQKYVDNLGLDVFRTEQQSASKDALFPSVSDDSFVWSWGADRGSSSFFKSSNYIRAFFYNADFDGASSIRSIDANTWPILALREGYLATAGSLSDSGVDSFLRPRPFMDALFRGATLGEAFIFSQPKLETSIACFGDPLQIFTFPLLAKSVTLVDPNKSWQEMETCLSESISYLYRKTNILKTIRDYIVSGSDTEVQLELDYQFNDLYNEFDEHSWKNTYVNLTSSLINFVVDRNATNLPFFYPNLNQYLTYSENKVTELVLDTLQNDAFVANIASSNIETKGSWIFETTLQSNIGSFRFYYLELEIALSFDDFDLDNTVIKKDSFEDSTNWFFEDFDGSFQPLNTNGITTSFEGKKIRYISKDTEILERGQFYWFRIRQKDDLQNFEWRYSREIIFR